MARVDRGCRPADRLCADGGGQHRCRGGGRDFRVSRLGGRQGGALPCVDRSDRMGDPAWRSGVRHALRDPDVRLRCGFPGHAGDRLPAIGNRQSRYSLSSALIDSGEGCVHAASDGQSG